MARKVDGAGMVDVATDLLEDEDREEWAKLGCPEGDFERWQAKRRARARLRVETHGARVRLTIGAK